MVHVHTKSVGRIESHTMKDEVLDDGEQARSLTLTHSSDKKTWTYVTEPVNSKSFEALLPVTEVPISSFDKSSSSATSADTQCLTEVDVFRIEDINDDLKDCHIDNYINSPRNSEVDSTMLGTPQIKELVDTSLSQPNENAVMAPFEYLRSLPSKGVREKLIDALNVWIEVPTEALTPIVSIISDVHNVSLMLDDVEDNSPLRRTKPATHSVFGIPQTVNSATYQIVDIISRTVQLNNADSLNAVIGEMKRLLVGQGLDLLWTHEVAAPSTQQYLQMVDGKTGGLFLMILKLMMASSNTISDLPRLEKLMILFGRFFQIRDDYANLVFDQYTEAKGFCEDLDEGKWGFILLHAYHNAQPTMKKVLSSILIQRRVAGVASVGHKEMIVKWLREEGSVNYTASALRMLQHELMSELEAVERETGKRNTIMRSILNSLEI
ncbi:isoprenoid synthase domain-containing protein [Xylaria cf. heliscus]|nr:isoprenoid synthase domain-containing protein [Xylaria cf. heliscus]